jgi:uncharacterized glyoxalase superfamily protein PhnB
MTDISNPMGINSALTYKDPASAFVWLESAFGFEPVFVLVGADGAFGHGQMKHGNATVMIGSEWDAHHVSPAALGGKNTQSLHVQLGDGIDIDAHCEAARTGGARIIAEPADQFYGDRTYRAADPEGHIFTFAVSVRQTTPEDWRKETGLIMKTRLD